MENYFKSNHLCFEMYVIFLLKVYMKLNQKFILRFNHIITQLVNFKLQDKKI